MTLPANLPIAFVAAARDFADTLRTTFASGMPARRRISSKAPFRIC